LENGFAGEAQQQSTNRPMLRFHELGRIDKHRDLEIALLCLLPMQPVLYQRKLGEQFFPELLVQKKKVR
jgi:hypothetical protein